VDPLPRGCIGRSSACRRRPAFWCLVDLGRARIDRVHRRVVVEVAHRCSSRCRSFSLPLVARVTAAETSSRAATARDPRSGEARRRRGQFRLELDGRQLLAGAAVLIGACFGYLQFSHEQQPLVTGPWRCKRRLRSSSLAIRFSKGFERLGNKDGQIERRLGGTYALEGVMNTSEQYHRPSSRRCASSPVTGLRNPR
jgi:hypothetical protein